jgi:hypothetical protein
LTQNGWERVSIWFVFVGDSEARKILDEALMIGIGGRRRIVVENEMPLQKEGLMLRVGVGRMT